MIIKNYYEPYDPSGSSNCLLPARCGETTQFYSWPGWGTIKNGEIMLKLLGRHSNHSLLLLAVQGWGGQDSWAASLARRLLGQLRIRF